MRKIFIIACVLLCGVGYAQEKVTVIEPSPVYSSYDAQYWDKLANEQRRLLIERFDNLVVLVGYNLTVQGDNEFLYDVRKVRYYLDQLGNDHITIREFEYRLNIVHCKMNKAIRKYNNRLKRNN